MKLAIKIEPNRDKLQLVRDLGYEAVEIYTSSKFISQEYIDMLSGVPLQYAVHAPTSYCDNSVLDFTRSIHSYVLTIHGIFKPHELGSLLEKSEDLTICLENEGAWGADNYEDDVPKPPELITIYSADDYLDIAKTFPNLSMTLDFEHADIKRKRSSFLPLIQAGQIKHLHVSGYSTKGTWHTPPLDNERNFREIIKMLQCFGYSGMLTMEMDVKYHVESILKEHMEFYNDCLKMDVT